VVVMADGAIERIANVETSPQPRRGTLPASV
jgi:hypothetical protein